MQYRFDYRYTCPDIDKNIDSIIDNIDDLVKNIIEDLVYDIRNDNIDLNNIVDYAQKYVDFNRIYNNYFEQNIEAIRNTNSDMRSEIENFIDDINITYDNDIEDRDYEIQELISKIEILENTNYLLEEEISNKNAIISELEEENNILDKKVYGD